MFYAVCRNLSAGQGIDSSELGKLCKQTEGKPVPFDCIQAALDAVKPKNKGELTSEEFIKVGRSEFGRLFRFLGRCSSPRQDSALPKSHTDFPKRRSLRESY